MVAVEEKKKDFEKQAKELFEFFEDDYDYPKSFTVRKAETIIDARLFVNSSLRSLKKQFANHNYRAQLEDLILLRQYIIANGIKKLGKVKDDARYNTPHMGSPRKETKSTDSAIQKTKEETKKVEPSTIGYGEVEQKKDNKPIAKRTKQDVTKNVKAGSQTPSLF